MKYLLLLIPLYSFCQTYSNPYSQPQQVQVTVKEDPYANIGKSFTEGMKAGAAAKAANAAAANAAAANANAQSEALKDNYENILSDNLIETPDLYKYIAVKRVSGWMVGGNYRNIINEIQNGGVYQLVNSEVKTKEKKLNEKSFFEPPIFGTYLNNPETLYLEWSRENISTYDRLSKLTLKNSNDEIVYQAEFKNKGYSQMLRSVNSDYRINKLYAKQKLIELKEYLDLGIITQEDFNRKSDPLKKVLIGN